MRYFRKSVVIVTVLPLAIAIVASMLHAAPKKGTKRAHPPKWEEEKEDRVFFKDAFSKLVGERPDYANLAKTTRPDPGTETGSTPGDGVKWSKLISSDTLEDEVKAYVQVLATDVNVPSKFKAGGYRKARRHFTTLATVFAVISEYDKDVRWKSQAAGLREAFARAGFNAKAGSENVYQESKARRDELADLVRGGSVTVPEAKSKVTWDKIANLSPLMSRFEVGFEKRLQGWLASEAQFKSNIDTIKHEAELLAALGRIIRQDGFDSFDDEDYVKHAVQLETAATEIAKATLTNSFAAAQKAAGRIQLSCTNCHGDFR